MALESMDRDMKRLAGFRDVLAECEIRKLDHVLSKIETASEHILNIRDIKHGEVYAEESKKIRSWARNIVPHLKHENLKKLRNIPVGFYQSKVYKDLYEIVSTAKRLPVRVKTLDTVKADVEYLRHLIRSVEVYQAIAAAERRILELALANNLNRWLSSG